MNSMEHALAVMSFAIDSDKISRADLKRIHHLVWQYADAHGALDNDTSFEMYEELSNAHNELHRWHDYVNGKKSKPRYVMPES